MDGLLGGEYLDSLQDKKRLSQNDASVRFEAEVDRIYLQTPDVLEVRHPDKWPRFGQAGHPRARAISNPVRLMCSLDL